MPHTLNLHSVVCQLYLNKTGEKIIFSFPHHIVYAKLMLKVYLLGWDREGGRETQEGGDMGIYVYV